MDWINQQKEEYTKNTSEYYTQKAVEYQQEYGFKKTTKWGHNDETDAFRHAFMQGR